MVLCIALCAAGPERRWTERSMCELGGWGPLFSCSPRAPIHWTALYDAKSRFPLLIPLLTAPAWFARGETTYPCLPAYQRSPARISHQAIVFPPLNTTFFFFSSFFSAVPPPSCGPCARNDRCFSWSCSLFSKPFFPSFLRSSVRRYCLVISSSSPPSPSWPTRLACRFLGGVLKVLRNSSCLLARPAPGLFPLFPAAQGVYNTLLTSRGSRPRGSRRDGSPRRAPFRGAPVVHPPPLPGRAVMLGQHGGLVDYAWSSGYTPKRDDGRHHVQLLQ